MEVHPILTRSISRAALLASACLMLLACKGAVTGAGDDPDDGDSVDGGSSRADARRADARADDDDGPADARRADARPDDDDDGPPDARVDDDLTFRSANLTNFESYPEPDSEECQEFNGCTWAGRFAFVDGKQTEDWVRAHNIVAIHSDFGDEYELKTLRLRSEGREIDVTVYDVCSDSDCSGCCTRNMRGTGFLIDIEKYTMERFGIGDGVIEWACLDCE